MTEDVPLIEASKNAETRRKIQKKDAHKRGKIAAIFLLIVIFGSFYLPYKELTIIIPKYVQIIVQNDENPCDDTNPRFYPRPAANFYLSESEKSAISNTDNENTAENIKIEAEKAEESAVLKSEMATKIGLDSSKWTIVISYKSAEMKLLNEQFLALTNFQDSTVNFEFLFVEKEDGNDFWSIEEILPEIMTDVVVFKSEADILLLPNLVAKKPIMKNGIICIEDDETIEQNIQQSATDFVKFTFRGEILGSCADSRQGPFMLSKLRFTDNTITSTVQVPAIVRSEPTEFLFAERILPQSYKITQPPPNFHELEENNWNVPPAIASHPKKTCEKNEIPIFIKSAIGNKNLRSFNRQIRDEYQKLVPGMKLKLYFVFGGRPTGMDALQNELEEFDDLIIANFRDEYNNLPLKTFAAHNFLNSKYFDDCDVQWTIFHDDDSVVNYQKLVNSVFKKETSDTAKFRCLDSNITAGSPMRSGKYGVNAHNFPMGYIFPAFCNGPAAAFTIKASQDIFNIAKSHSHSGFILENLMFTGIFREIAKDQDIKMKTGIAQRITKTQADGILENYL